MEQNKNNATEETRTVSETLASEMIRDEMRKSKSKDWIIVLLAASSVAIAIGMAVINHQNECDWRELFSNYDFISQDGEGINSINTGEQGDLINEPKSEDEKGQDER